MGLLRKEGTMKPIPILIAVVLLGAAFTPEAEARRSRVRGWVRPNARQSQLMAQIKHARGIQRALQRQLAQCRASNKLVQDKLDKLLAAGRMLAKTEKLLERIAALGGAGRVGAGSKAGGAVGKQAGVGFKAGVRAGEPAPTR